MKPTKELLQLTSRVQRATDAVLAAALAVAEEAGRLAAKIRAALR